MTHITSRNQLIEWASNNAPHLPAKQALDRGHVIVHGLFKGGWVIEARYNGQSYVIGIKPVGVDRRLICGLLKAVPVDDYIGGNTPLCRGDQNG